MTDEEKAEEYVKTKHSHIMSGTMKSTYRKIYLDGLAEGKKEVCKICEKKMIEGKSNINGCAYRRLGNEYCWEKEGK